MSLTKYDAPSTDTPTVKFTAGNTTVDAGAHLGEKRVLGFIFPSNWTTSAVTFQGSVDDVTYYDLYYSAGENEAPAAVTIASFSATKMVMVDPVKFAGCVYLKLVAGTTQASTDKTVKIITQTL
jgi:hypothetical protein